MPKKKTAKRVTPIDPFANTTGRIDELEILRQEFERTQDLMLLHRAREIVHERGEVEPNWLQEAVDLVLENAIAGKHTPRRRSGSLPRTFSNPDLFILAGQVDSEQRRPRLAQLIMGMPLRQMVDGKSVELAEDIREARRMWVHGLAAKPTRGRDEAIRLVALINGLSRTELYKLLKQHRGALLSGVPRD